MGENGRISLATAIQALRKELEEAILAGESESLRFEATTVEVKIQTEVSYTGKASGAVKWWLLGVGTEAAHTRTNSQTLTLTLTPHNLVQQEPQGRVYLSGSHDG